VDNINQFSIGAVIYQLFLAFPGMYHIQIAVAQPVFLIREVPTAKKDSTGF
jgi:hypothetical protein